jgi:hypothetical protein
MFWQKDLKSGTVQGLRKEVVVGGNSLKQAYCQQRRLCHFSFSPASKFLFVVGWYLRYANRRTPL